MTRLDDLTLIGRLFKVRGNSFFDQSGPNIWQLFGQFLKFYLTDLLSHKLAIFRNFGMVLGIKEWPYLKI